MAGSIQQAFDATATGSTTSCACTATLTSSASSAVVCAATNDATNASTVTCGDPTNGATSYTLLDDVLDTTDQQRMVTFAKPNSTAGGSVVVTANWSVANAFKALSVCDCIGVAGVVDQHTAAYQHAPTTTTDAQTSGATPTLTTQPALVVGFGFNANATGGAPAQGTGFSPPTTGVAVWWSFGGPTTLRVEYKRVTATTGVAATFTAASNVDSITAVIVIDEVGASLPAEPWLTTRWPNPPPPPPPVIVGGGRSFGPLAPLTVPPRAWAPQLATTYAPPPPPAFNYTARSMQPVAAQTVTPLSWAPEATPGDAPPPLLSPAVRAIRAIAPPAAPAVVPLSWASEYTLPDPPPALIQARPSLAGPVLPIPGAAVVPALAWKGVTAPVPIFAEHARPARRFGAFSVTPPPPLSWQPEFNGPDPQPPAPVIGQAVRSPLPVATGVTPLSWQPEFNGVPDPLPPQVNSTMRAPVAPLVAPPLSWRGWQPPPPIAPVPQAGGGLWAPVAPLAAPPLAWMTVPSWTAPPPGPPVGGGPDAPVAPLATPALAWLTVPPWTAPPPPAPTGGGRFAPVAPLVAPPLAWLGLSAGAGVAALLGVPSSEVGPFPGPLPVPLVSWLPHVTGPAIPVPPAAFDALARSMIPVASQVLTPLAWSPYFRAPLPPAPGVPQSLVFGPVPPEVAPVLAWAPSWGIPPAPGPVPTAPATFRPVLPPPAAPALAWAPQLAPSAAIAPAPGPGIQAAPLLPPAAPLLSWAFGPALAAAIAIPPAPSIQAAPILPPAAAPPLAWAPARAGDLAAAAVLVLSGQARPILPPVATPFAWGVQAPVLILRQPLAPSAPAGVLPLLQLAAPILGWQALAAAPVLALPAPARPAGFGPVLVPSLPNTTWLLPSTATPIRLELLTRSLEVYPVVVPAPNAPPPLQPQGYVSAPLPSAWNTPQLRIISTITTPPAPPPPIPLPEPSTMVLEEADGTPADLTGKTVVARYQPIDRSKQAALSDTEIVDALGGVVTKAWTAQDIRGVPTGTMLLQFIVIDGVGRPRTYPIGTYFRIPIVGRPR